ncbi:hypothetical protein DL93DRAFT_2091682 [Clavulina sp. PMI_390]|nr:hypothetical protein DL93DRAFT_2091682 [Clavulina sp. PMI_390]
MTLRKPQLIPENSPYLDSEDDAPPSSSVPVEQQQPRLRNGVRPNMERPRSASIQLPRSKLQPAQRPTSIPPKYSYQQGDDEEFDRANSESPASRPSLDGGFGSRSAASLATGSSTNISHDPDTQSRKFLRSATVPTRSPLPEWDDPEAPQPSSSSNQEVCLD